MKRFPSSCKDKFNFCSGMLPIRTYRSGALASYRLKKERENNIPKRTYSLIDLLTYSPKKMSAFTLAEVLITLGIIGVVAAMTIPSLITQHQKHVTVNKLKKALSIIEQAFTMSQAENGDVSELDFFKAGTNVTDNQEFLNTKTNEFVNNYIIKNIKLLKDCGYNNANNCNVYYVTSLDRTSVRLPMRSGRMFIIADGVRYRIELNSHTEKDEDGNSISVTSGNMLILADLNDEKGPNILGRDVFVIELVSSSKKLRMFGLNRSDSELRDSPTSGCNVRSSQRFYCGALIQQNGWQIKDDYLWK